MTEVIPAQGFDPVRWAQAAAELARNPALYLFIGLIALLVICKWPPWRKTKD